MNTNINTTNTQGKQEIWMVIGIDDLEGTIFAQCSTEEAAKRAKVLLETNGLEGMLKVEHSNLLLDSVVLNGKLVDLDHISNELLQETQAISGKEYRCNQSYLEATRKAQDLWEKLDELREELDCLEELNNSAICENKNLQDQRSHMIQFMKREAKELDLSFDAFCNQTGDDISASANAEYQTSDKNLECIKMIEMIRRLESSIPDEASFQDSDTILSDYMCWNLGNEGTGIANEIFDTYKFSTDKLGLMKVFADFTGTEFTDFLHNCVSVLEMQEKKFAINKGKDGLELKNFFFTFGTDPRLPYQNGYVVVKANDRKEAIFKFRNKYPDRHHGYINCSSIYTEDQWKVVTKRTNMGRLYKTIL